MPHSGSALINPYPVFEAVSLKAGVRVADLGCGRTGHFVFPASRVIGETGVIYAVDVVKNIVESIQSRVRSEGFHNVQAIWGDIENESGLPIPNQSVDICFLVNVVFMLKNRAAAFLAVKRILKTGGYFVVVEWVKNLGPLGPTPALMVNESELTRTLESSGFLHEKTISVGDYHLAYIYKKN